MMPYLPHTRKITEYVHHYMCILSFAPEIIKVARSLEVVSIVVQRNVPIMVVSDSILHRGRA